jgi:mannose-6-phosphate isomerase-like protein (cupin superfamily)
MTDRMISTEADAIAPDGSEVRILARTARGSMAQFSLGAGKISVAVVHRTVEEVWFFVSGEGQFWRSANGQETVTAIRPGLSIAIPVGTAFQFRNDGSGQLVAIGTTMPPWPGMEEAVVVEGKWKPSVG